ncbi:MAG TPA: pyridoxal phosphate-dependent aminotransferase [Firmicutes bacterium]|nr:pyridoxal phosphate-dependent aminotransferase [Bacillota bacterium]
MFAAHSKRGLTFNDIIFANNAQARARSRTGGAGAVINGTIGALLDDNGELVAFEAVDRIHRGLDVRKQSSYAPMGGYPAFLEAIEAYCFGESRPALPTRGIAVSGGLAGIHHAILNYTDPGDFVLTTDWHWDPYQAIADETGRKLKTFPLLSSGGPDWARFEETVKELACEQRNLFLLMNTPAHNPTGYSLNEDEFAHLLSICNRVEHSVVLFLDVAYIEYAAPESKNIFKLLARLSDNTLTLVDYSISKGFAKYGLRAAALFALHRDEAVLEEFSQIMLLSNRGTYGSVSSTGQLLLSALYEEKALSDQYREELQKWRGVLSGRAQIFFETLQPGIAMPYRDGFFAAVSSRNPHQVCEKLKEKDIFLVPLNRGIRVALCSLSEEESRCVAEALNSLAEKECL